jgi:uncharacterized protein (TIRG00374 family)
MPEAGAAVQAGERSGDSFQLLSRGLVRKVSLALVIGAVAYGSLLFYSDASSLIASTRHLTVRALVLATLVTCASHIIRFARWAYYLRRLGLSVPLVESVLVFFAGFSMSITPAKLGEVLKALMLRDSCDIALARSAPIVVAERITDVFGLLLLGGLGALALPGGVWVAVLAMLGVLALYVVLATKRLGVGIIDLVTRFASTRRFRHKLLEAYGSLGEMVTAVELAVATGFSFLAWGLQGFALAIIAHDFDGVTIDVPTAMVAYCAPLLAGTLAMIPGGLGLTEASMTGVIVRFGGPGASLPVAAAITIVTRLVTFWLAIALGFGALSAWRVRHRSLLKTA